MSPRPASPEQRVDQRVGGCVAVRVAGQAAVVGNEHAAQPQRDAVLQGVDVEPGTDADHVIRSLRSRSA